MTLSQNPVLLQEVLLSYDGETLSLGLPHGYGAAQFRSGGRYEGEWHQGHMHGDGIFAHPDGAAYKGQFHQSSISGDGTYTWAGAVYEGAVSDGLPHGKGKLCSADLDVVYDGDWLRGRKHGCGTWTQRQNGHATAYAGEWKDDQRHGYGEIVYPSGNKYSGEWLHDRKHGHGIMHWIDRLERYDGQWREDLMHGEGTYTWFVRNLPTPPSAPLGLIQHNRYEGRFVDGERTGDGILHYADGSVYEGTFSNGSKHGDGCYLTDKTLRFGALTRDRFHQEVVTLELKTPSSTRPIALLRRLLVDGALDDSAQVERFLARTRC